jgi:PEP-CTERM motif
MRVLIILIAILLTSVEASATVLFSDDFEGPSLDSWTGAFGPSHQGLIVTDPLDSSNRVLTFSGLNLGGDIFTATKVSLASVSFPMLSFDYLGLAQLGSVPGDLGGFLGISRQLDIKDAATDGVEHFWLAGTIPYGSAYGAGFEAQQLVDDGLWRSYEIALSPYVTSKGMADVYVMIEDFVSSGGVAGDAYFDNIRIYAATIPEPTTLALMTLGIAGIGYSRRKAA